MNAKNKNTAFDAIDDAQFLVEVLGGNQVVLAAFLASWSKPCQRLGPVLGKIEDSLKHDLKVLKLNVDDHPELCIWYEIWCIPTLLCFAQQKEAFRIVGEVGKRTILSRLKPVLTGLKTPEHPI